MPGKNFLSPLKGINVSEDEDDDNDGDSNSQAQSLSLPKNLQQNLKVKRALKAQKIEKIWQGIPFQRDVMKRGAEAQGKVAAEEAGESKPMVAGIQSKSNPEISDIGLSRSISTSIAARNADPLQNQKDATQSTTSHHLDRSAANVKQQLMGKTYTTGTRRISFSKIEKRLEAISIEDDALQNYMLLTNTGTILQEDLSNAMQASLKSGFNIGVSEVRQKTGNDIYQRHLQAVRERMEWEALPPGKRGIQKDFVSSERNKFRESYIAPDRVETSYNEFGGREVRKVDVLNEGADLRNVTMGLENDINRIEQQKEFEKVLKLAKVKYDPVQTAKTLAVIEDAKTRLKQSLHIYKTEQNNLQQQQEQQKAQYQQSMMQPVSSYQSDAYDPWQTTSDDQFDLRSSPSHKTNKSIRPTITVASTIPTNLLSLPAASARSESLSKSPRAHSKSPRSISKSPRSLSKSPRDETQSQQAGASSLSPTSKASGWAKLKARTSQVTFSQELNYNQQEKEESVEFGLKPISMVDNRDEGEKALARIRRVSIAPGEEGTHIKLQQKMQQAQQNQSDHTNNQQQNQQYQQGLGQSQSQLKTDTENNIKLLNTDADTTNLGNLIATAYNTPKVEFTDILMKTSSMLINMDSSDLEKSITMQKTQSYGAGSGGWMRPQPIDTQNQIQNQNIDSTMSNQQQLVQDPVTGSYSQKSGILKSGAKATVPQSNTNQQTPGHVGTAPGDVDETDMEKNFRLKQMKRQSSIALIHPKDVRKAESQLANKGVYDKSLTSRKDDMTADFRRSVSGSLSQTAMRRGLSRSMTLGSDSQGLNDLKQNTDINSQSYSLADSHIDRMSSTTQQTSATQQTTQTATTAGGKFVSITGTTAEKDPTSSVPTAPGAISLDLVHSPAVTAASSPGLQRGQSQSHMRLNKDLLMTDKQKQDLFNKQNATKLDSKYGILVKMKDGSEKIYCKKHDRLSKYPLTLKEQNRLKVIEKSPHVVIAKTYDYYINKKFRRPIERKLGMWLRLCINYVIFRTQGARPPRGLTKAQLKRWKIENKWRWQQYKQMSKMGSEHPMVVQQGSMAAHKYDSNGKLVVDHSYTNMFHGGPGTGGGHFGHFGFHNQGPGYYRSQMPFGAVNSMYSTGASTNYSGGSSMYNDFDQFEQEYDDRSMTQKLKDGIRSMFGLKTSRDSQYYQTQEGTGHATVTHGTAFTAKTHRLQNIDKKFESGTDIENDETQDESNNINKIETQQQQKPVLPLVKQGSKLGELGKALIPGIMKKKSPQDQMNKTKTVGLHAPEADLRDQVNGQLDPDTKKFMQNIMGKQETQYSVGVQRRMEHLRTGEVDEKSGIRKVKKPRSSALDFVLGRQGDQDALDRLKETKFWNEDDEDGMGGIASLVDGGWRDLDEGEDVELISGAQKPKDPRWKQAQNKRAAENAVEDQRKKEEALKRKNDWYRHNTSRPELFRLHNPAYDSEDHTESREPKYLFMPDPSQIAVPLKPHPDAIKKTLQILKRDFGPKFRTILDIPQDQLFSSLNNAWPALPDNRKIGWIRKSSKLERTPHWHRAIYDTNSMTWLDPLIEPDIEDYPNLFWMESDPVKLVEQTLLKLLPEEVFSLPGEDQCRAVLQVLNDRNQLVKTLTEEREEKKRRDEKITKLNIKNQNDVGGIRGGADGKSRPGEKNYLEAQDPSTNFAGAGPIFEDKEEKLGIGLYDIKPDSFKRLRDPLIDKLVDRDESLFKDNISKKASFISTNTGQPGMLNKDDPSDPNTNFGIMKRVKPHFVAEMEAHRCYRGGHNYEKTNLLMAKYMDVTDIGNRIREDLEAGGSRLVYHPNYRELPPLGRMALGELR